MSKSYNKNSLLSSPSIQLYQNLLDKSISSAHFLPLPLLKFIPLISLALIQSESIILSDLAYLIAPLKGISVDSADRYLRYSLHNENYDFHAFYSFFIREIMSFFKVKHKDNKVLIALDHMYVEDRYTVLMFSLRIGKTGIPLWFKEFIYHDREAYLFPIFKESIKFCHDLVKLNNPDANITFTADRWFGNHIKILDYIQILGDHFVFRAKGLLLVLNYDQRDQLYIWKSINKLDSYTYKSKFYPHSLITREHRFETNIVISSSFNHKEPYYLLTNGEMESAVKDYSKRFGTIEFLFKAQKSNGFFLEETQIKDLNTFGSLYTCICLAQALVTILGIDHSKNNRCYKKIKIRTTKMVNNKRVRIYSYFHIGLIIVHYVWNAIHNEFELFKRLVLYDI